MKRIILDFYRRWGLGIVAILTLHFSIETYLTLTRLGAELFTIQILLALVFLWTNDLFRGQGKVLAILPVTGRQSGRALWIATVLLPGAALSVISVFCLYAFEHRTLAEIVAPALLQKWALFLLILGATFGCRALLPSFGATFALDRLRGAASLLSFLLPIVAWYFLQKPIHPILALLIIVALAGVAVWGWLCADRVISFTARIRVGVSTASTGKKATTLSPSGSGGLRYLVEQTLVRTVGISVGMFAFMAILTNLRNPNQPIDVGLFNPVLLVVALSHVQNTKQLRFLRTLPLSPLTLTSVALLLPVAVVALLGVILGLFMIPISGSVILWPLLNICVSVAGVSAVGTTIVIWRGLETLSYLLMFPFIIGGHLGGLALELAFGIRVIPPWVTVTIHCAMVAIAFLITLRLVSRSSAAYRIRPNTSSEWD